MNIKTGEFGKRKVWTLDNGHLSLAMMQGGGNICSLTLNDKPDVNPYWVPIWQTIEPAQFKPSDDFPGAGGRLLASISGHNLCLGWFGDPSEDEAAHGMSCHGEAPVAQWKVLKKKAGKKALSLTAGCKLPVASMRFKRTLSTTRGSGIVHVHERVRNTSKRDLPFTMCQHVTLGPPFLEKGVTLFDMPATKSHTFPEKFGPKQRLAINAEFEWPNGPGAKGKTVDMRTLGKTPKASSDFSTQLIDPKRRVAWFSAVNPVLGLLIAYVWVREDFPWVGNWEESYARTEKPWSGESLTRGMEFTNTPFPEGLRQAVDRGTFHGRPTYRWIPARGKIDIEYAILAMPVEPTVKGVADIRPNGDSFSVDLMK